MNRREADDVDVIAVPALQAGGRVERTGIALVHEGEEIRPAPGSEAVIGPATASVAGGPEVHLYFPVEVHVSGGILESDRREIEGRIWTALDSALS